MALMTLFFALLLASSLPVAFGQAAAIIFVATTGNDATGDGSAAKPFATPTRAFASIGAYKLTHGGACPAGGYTVQLAGGEYYQDETLTITPDNSCTDGGAIVVTGGDTTTAQPPLISGGLLLGAWTPLPGYAGVFTLTLPPRAGGLVGSRTLYSTDGKRRLLSRSNVMTAETVGQWGVGYKPGDVTAADAAAVAASGASAELVIWHNWVSSQNKIQSINFTNSSIAPVGVAGDGDFNAGGNRWALQNVPNPASLSAGEFYWTLGGGGATTVLVYASLPGEDPTNTSSVQFVADHLPTVVALAGSNASAPVSNVRFVNVTFAHSAAILEIDCMGSGCACQSDCDATAAAVHATNAQACTLDHVSLYGAGRYAVWFDEGSVDCAITHSHVYDLGGGGVRIGTGVNSGTPSSSPAIRTTVTDTTIENGGLVVPAGTGVFAQESYNSTIAHNHIHALFYTGVAVGWTWGYAADSAGGAYVGFNLIHDIFQGELSDGGCVYILGRSPGTRVDNNVCFNVQSYGYGGWGYYLDEGSSNVTVVNNVVYGTKDASFHQHYGTDNLIENNIFAFGSSLPCDDPNQGDCDRSAVKSSQHNGGCGPQGEGQGCNSSFAFQRNIVLLGAPNASAAPWVANNTDIVRTYGPTVGVWNMTFAGNLYWHASLPAPPADLVFGPTGEPLSFAQWVAMGKDAGSVVQDPLFADAAALNFTLLPGSPALALGFQQIDTSTVGPRAG